MYLHCRPDGVPFYVGKGHGERSHMLNKRNLHHRNVVAKYGADKILVFVFPCKSETQAFEDEITWIAQLRNDGYALCNQTAGGEGVRRPLTVAQRLHLSEINKGKVMLEKTKAAIVASRKGIPLSDEHKRKVSLANSGKKRTADIRAQMRERMLNMSDEYRAKLSRARKGKKMSLETRAKISAAMKALPFPKGRFDSKRAQV